MTVDLPTPPLPEPMQITFLTRGERALGQPALAAEPLREALLLLVGEHVEADRDRRHAERLDALDDGLLEVGRGSGSRPW